MIGDKKIISYFGYIVYYGIGSLGTQGLFRNRERHEKIHHILKVMLKLRPVEFPVAVPEPVIAPNPLN